MITAARLLRHDGAVEVGDFAVAAGLSVMLAFVLAPSRVAVSLASRGRGYEGGSAPRHLAEVLVEPDARRGDEDVEREEDVEDAGHVTPNARQLELGLPRIP